MYLLYGMQFLLLLCAVGLLATPFVVNKNILSKNFLLASGFILVFSFTIYQFTTDKTALSYWLTQGKTHYQLQEQFNALGGIDGVIARVQAKLNANPTDAKGWWILAKLYAAKHDDAAAAAAVKKARELSP